MIKFNKIFGIGLSKTGLHSLAGALDTLGIKVLQNWKMAGEDIRALFGHYKINDIDVIKVPCLKAYDAFIPGSGIYDVLLYPNAVYKQLDKEYPNSKFILTVRDLDSWLISIKRHIEKNQRNPEYRGNTLLFDEDRYVRQRRNHHQGVLNYFKDRPHDLLVLDICAGEGWEKLCSFLELPVPDIPFPHRNRAKECRAIAKI